MRRHNPHLPRWRRSSYSCPRFLSVVRWKGGFGGGRGRGRGSFRRWGGEEGVEISVDGSLNSFQGKIINHGDCNK